MLTTFFADIKDFRRPQARKYELAPVLLFATLAILCNAKSYRDIARFFVTHFNALKSDFNLLWKRPPAYTTIRYAICGLDPLELETAFRTFARSLVSAVKDPEQPGPAYIPIALDGKTLRGSYDHYNDTASLHKLFFFDQLHRIVLGHLDTEGKGAEMEHALTILEEVRIKQSLFTLDALHCQKKTFEQADSCDHGLLVQVKNNQQQLRKDLGTIAGASQPTESYGSGVTGGHGCVVSRRASVWHGPCLQGAILDPKWQQMIKTVIRIERFYERFDTRSKVYKDCSEVAWYVCNRILDAAQAHNFVRGHWGIENANNYVRDVTLDEDGSRIRIRPGNKAVLRSAALNVLRGNKATNVREELYLNSLNWRRIYSYQHCI